MTHTAENDAPYLGHGPLCEWDEDMARMWCSREHEDRMAAASRLPRLLHRLVWGKRPRVTPPEQGTDA